MSKIELFHFPSTCSRVAMTALEKIGVEYSDRAIDLGQGEQQSPEYLAINPKGKVPILRVDGHLITENAAINIYLNEAYPEANLLPGKGDPILYAQARSAVIWCASTLHIAARGLFRPIYFSEQYPESVRKTVTPQFTKIAQSIEAQVKDGWWFGNTWSIVDHYLFFGLMTAKNGGFSFEDFPNIVAHSKRLADLAVFRQCIARETKALKTAGISLPHGMDLAATL